MQLNIIETLGEWNPQLFREIKGRLKAQNVIIVTILSLMGQGIIYSIYKAQLPFYETFNRYCVGQPPEKDLQYYTNNIPNNYCLKDLLDQWMIIDELWWLDIFICLSVTALFALLVIGSYMLVDDLCKENQKGTLNFIRLSPQSSTSIFLGKILGVPILLYLFILLALPFHLWAGIAADIPLPLILCFYITLATSCLFFYSFSLIYGLVSYQLRGFQPWLVSGGILGFLFITTPLIFYQNYLATNTLMDWILLFNPTIILSYLVDSTFISKQAVDYLSINSIKEMTFYGHLLSNQSWKIISFVLINYSLWSYWLEKGINRSFHNQKSTIFSKQQSYFICASFVIISVGFTNLNHNDVSLGRANFVALQLFNLLLFLQLIVALSPERQTLQEWARYRHKVNSERRHLFKDLIFGEKSPSHLAILINLLIVNVYTIGQIIFTARSEDKLIMLVSLLFNASLFLIYACLAQLVLFAKTKQRSIAAGVSIGYLFVLPLVVWGVSTITYHDVMWVWLFSVFSVTVIGKTTTSTLIMSFLGEWLAIALLTLQMNRLLKQAGKSETAKLLSGAKQA